MTEGVEFSGSSDEARLISRLVNAWSAAQTVVEQLQPVLHQLGLLKPNGALDTAKVAAALTKARQR